MNPIIFTPKEIIPIWGFTAVILVVAAIVLFAANDMLKTKSAPIRLSVLAGICVLTVVILTSAIHGSKSEKPIYIYEDRVVCEAGTFHFDSIEGVGLYPFSNARYVNGVVRGGTEYRLMVVLPQGKFGVVGSDQRFAIDSVKGALESAIARYKQTK